VSDDVGFYYYPEDEEPDDPRTVQADHLRLLGLSEEKIEELLKDFVVEDEPDDDELVTSRYEVGGEQAAPI
jgi:hypothetical protein